METQTPTQQPQSNSTAIIAGAVVLVALIAAGAYVMTAQSRTTVVTTPTEQNRMMQDQPMEATTPAAADDSAMAPSGAMESDEKKMAPPTKEFTINATDYSFSMKEIKVKKGDTVKITFTNTKGTHDWVLDEFNVKTKMLNANESETVEFYADKAGTFEYYCSVGQHRAMGMKGNLIVEE